MKLYDFQFHAYTPEFLEYIRCRDEYPLIDENDVFWCNEKAPLPFNVGFFEGSTMLIDLCDISEGRLKHMDDAGVTLGVISPSPGYEFLDREASIKHCKIFNDAVAETSKKYPDRFRGAIALPTPYVDDAIEELERAVNELGLEYFHTHSNYGEDILADDKYIPLLAKCEELGVPIYIHPGYIEEPYLANHGMTFAGAGFGFAVDVMITSMLIVLKGRLDKFPNLKIILGHMGEFFPFILERMDNRFFSVPIPVPEVNCEHTFTYYFKNNFIVDVGGITDPKVAMFVIDKIGIDSIIYGSDYPYESYDRSIDFINNLPISDEDKEKIFYKNAEKYILRNK